MHRHIRANFAPLVARLSRHPRQRAENLPKIALPKFFLKFYDIPMIYIYTEKKSKMEVCKMNEVGQPKVFISYSWAVKDWTVNLATRLMNDGVETKVDFWDLKEGQDKYKFMESMVADQSIDYVLILCDETYTKKANDRTGGVGDETVIITSELYGKSSQTKFLPLVLETDEKDEATRPVYIKSRIYFDFTDENNYENEYERLLRHIYNKPLIPKPKLGSMPEWLNENKVSLSSLSKSISILKSSANETRKNAAVADFYQEFSSKAKEFIIKNSNNIGQEILSKIGAMKPLRDSYLDFLKEIIFSERDLAEFVCRFFENVYNELMLLPPHTNSWSNSHYEHYHFFIWETFVCTVTYLLHYEKYKELYLVLTHTYFLQKEISPLRSISPASIMNFGCYCENLEYSKENSRMYSFTADVAVKRIKEPLITQESFAETDIFICQMSAVLNIKDGAWFPTSYVYANINPFGESSINVWKKLPSKQYCLKILPLFNAKTIEELKCMIQNNPIVAGYGYPGSLSKVPKIPLTIGNYDIASLP